MTKPPLPKGFDCECGKFNPFVSYVYAHWNIVLTFTCECKREYTILEGAAEIDER